MQEKQLYEYAVIRLVPRVEREEFFNVGVIVYCGSKNFLQTKFELNKERLSVFSDALKPADLQKRLNVFQQICSGNIEGGMIASLPIASRFRWLTAARSTIIQVSPTHSGLSDNLSKTLDNLYNELVK